MVDIHVAPKNNAWFVAREGDRPTRMYPTKEDAMLYAMQYAREHDAFVLPHGSDGVVQTVLSPKQKISSAQHVIPREGGWAVVSENEDCPFVECETKDVAVETAHTIARGSNMHVWVHGREEKFTRV